MRILTVQNRMGIGDMVIFLPFIEAISKNFKVPVSLLVKENSKAAQFLKDNKYIDKIIILDRDNKLKNGRHDGIIGSFNLILDLKKYNFDKIFIIRGDHKIHKEIIQTLNEDKKSHGYETIILTFDEFISEPVIGFHNFPYP